MVATMPFLPNKNFMDVFKNFDVYFQDEIKEKWVYILQENDTEYFLPDLVREFYARFMNRDINHDAGTIVWRW